MQLTIEGHEVPMGAAPARVCAYPGCPVEFVPSKPWQLYHADACRTRAWRRRHGHTPSKPAHASRDGSRTGIRARSGPQISYHKAVEVIATLLERLDPDVCGASPMFCRHVAEAALLDAVPARQRERLEGRRA